MRKLGYARVSTQDQTLEAQKEALLDAGAGLLFTEKVSGANRNRPQLSAMLENLQEGDLVLVARLDRFARSTLDMLTLTEAITAKGAAFRSLAEPWADTTTPHGRMPRRTAIAMQRKSWVFPLRRSNGSGPGPGKSPERRERSTERHTP